MTNIGFVQGEFQQGKNILTPLGRRVEAYLAIENVWSSPFIKLLEDEYIGVLAIDVSFGLSLRT